MDKKSYPSKVLGYPVTQHYVTWNQDELEAVHLACAQSMMVLDPTSKAELKYQNAGTSSDDRSKKKSGHKKGGGKKKTTKTDGKTKDQTTDPVDKGKNNPKSSK